MANGTIIECHRHYPVPYTGIFTNDPPYWQLALPCRQNRPFNSSTTEQCLTNRTVYVIGNSIPRGILFSIVELLSNKTTSRENQKQKCPKLEIDWETDTCHTEIGSTKLRYLYMQFMDGYHYTNRSGYSYIVDNDSIEVKNGTTLWKYSALQNRNVSTKDAWMETHNNVLPDTPVQLLEFMGASHRFYENDGCIDHKSTRECLKSFFTNSTIHDVLIFTVGYSYAIPYHWKINYEDLSRYLNMRHWLNASAQNFQNNVKNLFNGTIIRVTHADHKWGMERYNGILRSYEQMLENIWETSNTNHTSDINNRRYVIDQFAINQNRLHLYDDHMHFSEDLTRATVQQVLNILCPQ